MIRPAFVRASDISIVIPARNASATIDRCLRAIGESDEQPLEVIVFDDASTDETAAVARRHGARVITSRRRCGPAAARNRAARTAQGEVLLFIDADVLVRSDTVQRVAAFFTERLDIDALFGSYDDKPAAPGFFSQFKNLQHHYVHQTSRSEAATFWTACGAIRREAFEDVGGFDERWYTIQDIELGLRLGEAGRRVALVKDLQVTHTKSYTFASWLRSDVLARALPWSLLILDRRTLRDDLNVKWSDRASGLLAIAAPLWLAGPLALPVRSLFALASLAALLLLQRRFLRFLAHHRGVLFAARSSLALAGYYAYSTLAFGAALLLHLAGRGKRPFWWPPAPEREEEVALAGIPDETTPLPSRPLPASLPAIDPWHHRETR
ncbi:MAG: glycosyltransferase family A protein [Planctomycetota bacterium]